MRLDVDKSRCVEVEVEYSTRLTCTTVDSSPRGILGAALCIIKTPSLAGAGGAVSVTPATRAIPVTVVVVAVVGRVTAGSTWDDLAAPLTMLEISVLVTALILFKPFRNAESVLGLPLYAVLELMSR